jgi:urease accessory protein UreE
MSAIYNPEADTMAQIEKLELEARELRKRIQAASQNQYRQALSSELADIQNNIARLQARLP